MTKMTDLPREYSEWFLFQLDGLFKAADNASLEEGEFKIEWPLLKERVHAQDLYQTTNYILKLFPDEAHRVQCALNRIDELIVTPCNSPDYFFIRMHCIAHWLISTLFSHLSEENLVDTAYIELSALFFAAIATRKYFNIALLSPMMAQEIIASFKDIEYLQKEQGVMFSYEETYKMCATMLSDLFEREKQLYI